MFGFLQLYFSLLDGPLLKGLSTKWASWSQIVNLGMENKKITIKNRGAVRHWTSLAVVGQVRPSSDKSDFRRPPSLGGYALMNQNTTIEATETKMNHVSVISIKKGSI